MSTVLGLAAAAITVVQLVLLARIVSSWVLVLAGAGARGGVVPVDAALARLTEPILTPVRRVSPPLRLGSVTLDLSIPWCFSR